MSKSNAPAAISGGVLGFIVLMAVGLPLLIAASQQDTPGCGDGQQAVGVLDGQMPAQVAGFSGVQLLNAGEIMRAAKDLHLTVRDQTIGVMTAIGESGLQVLDHGDAAGPDSRGLFQQRTGWGSLEDRMNPYQSATAFFTKEAAIAGRDQMTPTAVAHQVQANADPYYYTRFWDQAVQIVTALGGVTTGITGDPASCQTGQHGTNLAGRDGWVLPASGPITSPFGPRGGVMHNGLDIGAACGAPVHAALAGTVVFAGFDTGGNGTIDLDNGAGLHTLYLHEYASGILVHAGQQIQAGDQIGLVGSSGDSTGCHLHFAIKQNGAFEDPVAILAAHGITLS